MGFRNRVRKVTRALSLHRNRHATESTSPPGGASHDEDGTVAGPSVPLGFDGTSDEPPATEEAGASSERRDITAAASLSPQLGVPHRDQLQGQLDLFAPEIAAATTTTAPLTGARSSSAATTVVRSRDRTAAAPDNEELTEEGRIVGFNQLPPPRRTPRLTPPGVHPGPADTSSVATSPARDLPDLPRALNPQAPIFDAMGNFFLRRGQVGQPGALDPMDIPDDGLHGDANMRRRRDAARHAAMVYRRLMVPGQQDDAEGLNREFERIFGEYYINYRFHLIHHEPDDPPASEGEAPEDV